MKKITVFVLFITLVSILSSCGGKKAELISLPNMSDIESIDITQNNQTFEKTDSEWISELINEVSAGEPTSKKTVQDVPNVSEYIKIDFALTDGSIRTLFIYQEKNKWYIEQPYQGIYLASDELIEIIDNVD